MMKKTLILAAIMAATLNMGTARAADPFIIQLKWVTQAQFAGYYVAKEKGFYDEVDLDVTIKPGGPDIAPEQVIAAGGADAIVDWMPAALAAREKGTPLVNIAQVFEKSGLMLTCRKDSGVTSSKDFSGRTIGVWFFGNEYPFFNWMNKLNYKILKEGEKAADGITVLKQGFNVDPLLQKQADCISTMTYNEYWQLIEAGMKPDQLTTFKYEDEGVATLEDGLYTVDKKLQDPKEVDKLARFVKAYMMGWNYAVAHPDEAVEIILKNDETGAQTKEHQTTMMQEVAKLIGPKNTTGKLDEVAYNRTVDTLLTGGSDPVISKKPVGAFSHMITEAASKL